MCADCSQYSRPKFRVLSDKQIEDLHLATLQILEKTGIAFECQKAIDILAEVGADVSDPNRVKIPARLLFGGQVKDPNIIILDDPISSFDSHKKYAILNRLFSSNNKNLFSHSGNNSPECAI